MSNVVEIAGKLTRIKTGRGKVAWAFFSVQPFGQEKGQIKISAFEDAAERATDFSEGDEIRVRGHLTNKKDKETGAWSLEVVADSVQAAEEMPF